MIDNLTLTRHSRNSEAVRVGYLITLHLELSPLRSYCGSRAIVVHTSDDNKRHGRTDQGRKSDRRLASRKSRVESTLALALAITNVPTVNHHIPPSLIACRTITIPLSHRLAPPLLSLYRPSQSPPRSPIQCRQWASSVISVRGAATVLQHHDKHALRSFGSQVWRKVRVRPSPYTKAPISSRHNYSSNSVAYSSKRQQQ